MNLGLIILLGGLSSRFGEPKAFLPWGEGNLLTHLLQRARSIGFSEIILSVGDDVELNNRIEVCVEELSLGGDVSIRIVPDERLRCGPMGGIYTALKEGHYASYGVISVDMPFFPLEKFVTWDATYPSSMAVIASVHGEIQPLGGLYRKGAVEILKGCIDAGEYSLKEALSILGEEVVYADESKESLSFVNMNTFEDYQWARAKELSELREVSVISVVASKRKTGKTTLVETLVKRLSSEGIAVGVVKSDGHGFQMDREGSDTDRAMTAGAKVAAIVGPNETAIRIRTKEKAALYDLAQQLPVDLAILETRSQGIFPVVEVFQEGYTEEFITPKENLVARLEMKEGKVLEKEPLEELVQNIRRYLLGEEI